MIAYPHHCRYGCAGSKSDSDGVFWTSSEVLFWRSDGCSSGLEDSKNERAVSILKRNMKGWFCFACQSLHYIKLLSAVLCLMYFDDMLPTWVRYWCNAFHSLPYATPAVLDLCTCKTVLNVTHAFVKKKKREREKTCNSSTTQKDLAGGGMHACRTIGVQ